LEFDKVAEAVIDILLERKKISKHPVQGDFQPILDKYFNIDSNSLGNNNKK
jgi:hypothetical protein